MELVYLWVEDYKNIKKQGFNFSPRFECTFYDEYEKDEEGKEKLKNGCKLEIKSKEHIENIFDDINITAIVGKNGSGKSSILEILFYKTKYRYRNKITFFIILVKNTYYIYLFKSGELVLKKEISLDSSINIQLTDEMIDSKKNITEYDYLSIFYSNLYNGMPYSFNNEDKSFIDISTLNLIKKKDRQTFSIKNALKMLSSIDIDLPIKVPSLQITLNAEYLEDNSNSISQRIGELVYASNNSNTYFYNILIAELICRYYDRMGITESEINEIANFKELYELFIKNKCNESDFEKLYNIIDKIQNLTIDNLTIKLSITSDIDFINEIVNTINSLENSSYLRFDIFRLNFNENLSTGEEALLFQFANIYHSLKKMYLGGLFNEYSVDDIVILIDEGDITFHPQWQKEYLSYLIYFLSKNFSEKKFHLVLTSHSPFLLSDIPKQNIIFLEEGKQVKGINKKQTFGANIHTLLSDSFFMEDGLMGEFAKSKINEIIDFHKEVEENKKEKGNCFSLRRRYIRLKPKFWQTQSIIGEEYLKQVVKNHLRDIENILLGHNQAKKEEITRLRKEADRLEKM